MLVPVYDRPSVAEPTETQDRAVMESRSATIHRKMPIPARQLPITESAHKAGNGRRPLPAATAIAQSARARRGRNGSPHRQAELLPVPYFHVVFTLPPAAAEIAFQNKRTVYGLLMRAAAQALTVLAAKRLGARIGLIALLHTWGQTLTHHPHVHCLVPGGGVALDGKRWIGTRPNFLLSVHAVSKAFRRLFLDGLEAALRRKESSSFFGDLARLAEQEAFDACIRALRQSPFVVYAKPPFGGPARLDQIARENGVAPEAIEV